MFAMTYRVYLRWPDSRTTDKTTTDDQDVAAFAFARLKARDELRGQPVGIALTKDGRQLDFVDCSADTASNSTAHK